MAKLKIAAKESNGTLHDQASQGVGGGTGGASQAITTTGVKTIKVAYNTAANAQIANGYITAQKGAHKFRVVDQSAANATTVTLVNTAVANLRTANQGTINGYNTSNVAFNATRITNKFVYDFSGNKMRYVLSPTVAGNGFANVASY